MSVLLQPVFTQLWHSNPAVRLDASVQLVGHLEEAQRSSVAVTGDATTDTEEATTQQVDGLAPDVAYTLKRLIRGLASPRESSRLGFAVALTEVSDSRIQAKISCTPARQSKQLTDMFSAIWCICSSSHAYLTYFHVKSTLSSNPRLKLQAAAKVQKSVIYFLHGYLAFTLSPLLASYSALLRHFTTGE